MDNTESNSDLILIHISNIIKVEKLGARIQNILYSCSGIMFKLYINSNTVPENSVFVIYVYNEHSGWVTLSEDLISNISDINLAHVETIMPDAFDDIIKYAEQIIVNCSRFLPNNQYNNNRKQNKKD